MNILQLSFLMHVRGYFCKWSNTVWKLRIDRLVHRRGLFITSRRQRLGIPRVRRLSSVKNPISVSNTRFEALTMQQKFPPTVSNTEKTPERNAQPGFRNCKDDWRSRWTDRSSWLSASRARNRGYLEGDYCPSFALGLIPNTLSMLSTMWGGILSFHGQ